MNKVGLILFGDFIAFWAAFAVMLLIRFDDRGYAFALHQHFLPFVILYLTWVLIFYIFGLYDLLNVKPTIPYFKRWVIAILCSLATGILLFYFVSIFGISPKINLVIQVVLFGFFSFIFRRTIYNLFSKFITEPAILVGNSEYLLELEKTISANPQIGLRIIAHPASMKDLSLEQEKMKNVIIILDKNTNTPDEQILNLYKKGVEVMDITQAYERFLQKIPVGYASATWILNNIDKDENFVYKISRRLMDIVISIAILVVASPFLLVAIIARLIEDGQPIFYNQKRVGLNGKIFYLYKLRSMVALSPDGSAETAEAKWCTGHNDERITRLGQIIRRTHLDEVPQVINILKGDISLVGPRPERPEFVATLEDTIPHYKLRHIIRPGFTGWAQIKYHYANTMDASKEKFEYDLYYIKNRNIFIDIGVIIRTIQIIFTH
jgi:exopolysaccharide biosynthesis polyprenyl glycosylphosphotransferase